LIFWTNIDYMLAWCKAYFIGLCACLDDVALFHWLVQNQDCWLSTTKKSLNSHQTLFLMRGQSLGTRLTKTWRLWPDILFRFSLLPLPTLSSTHKERLARKTSFTGEAFLHPSWGTFPWEPDFGLEILSVHANEDQEKRITC